METGLYIVSIPIGNKDDITIRALDILHSVDFIICEELKKARRFLSNFSIQKELIALNEHTENEAAPQVLKILLDNKSCALISDCGTPLFSDPGHYLLELCIKNKIKVHIIPGVNSVITAITGSSLHIEKYFYFGWLSPKKEIRQRELNYLKKIHEVIVLMDTPYRLKQLLKDIMLIFSNDQKLVLAFQLTQPDELFLRDSVSKILQVVFEKNLKGEFVLLIDNRKIQN